MTVHIFLISPLILICCIFLFSKYKNIYNSLLIFSVTAELFRMLFNQLLTNVIQFPHKFIFVTEFYFTFIVAKEHTQYDMNLLIILKLVLWHQTVSNLQKYIVCTWKLRVFIYFCVKFSLSVYQVKLVGRVVQIFYIVAGFLSISYWY